jgi:hypothetical protein
MYAGRFIRYYTDMLHLTDVIQPKPDEHVEAVFRRHRSSLIPSLCGAALLIAIPFFWLFSLTRAGSVGVITFALLLAAGLVIGIRSLLLWDANALIVTNERLVCVRQKGIWHRVVQEVALHSIHELACESHGMKEAFFHIGTLRVRAGGSTGELVVERIAGPERARAIIEQLREAKPRVSSSALHKEVHALVDHASVSTLETVKALLEKQRA